MSFYITVYEKKSKQGDAILWNFRDHEKGYHLFHCHFYYTKSHDIFKHLQKEMEKCIVYLHDFTEKPKCGDHREEFSVHKAAFLDGELSITKSVYVVYNENCLESFIH